MSLLCFGYILYCIIKEVCHQISLPSILLEVFHQDLQLFCFYFHNCVKFILCEVVMEMTVTYLMPSTSVVLVAKLPRVKAAAQMHLISLYICNKFICMGGWMNDIKNQTSGQSRQDSFC